MDATYILFATAGNCVSERHWHEAETVFAEGRDTLERHFAMEEKAMFIAGENAIGSGGPTGLMRMEHQHIRSVLGMLDDALERFDADGFTKYSETLNIMLRQHTSKRESIRYLMAGQTLSTEEEYISISKNTDARRRTAPEQ